MYNNFKKSIREGKKIIARNTKKINKIKKLIDKCYKIQIMREKAENNKGRCPKGTRKNKSTGKCEKK